MRILRKNDGIYIHLTCQKSIIIDDGYVSLNKQSMADVLAELVSDGTLTQEQADAVSTAIKPAKKAPKESEE